MTNFGITAPIFTDPDLAREHLEAQRWPNGPFCPHCGNADQERITKLQGKSTRPGVHKCKECRKPFTVTIGTVFERSKIPLNKWLLATFLLTYSQKGMSAHRLHRMMGVTYKTAWFMFHRIREAMRDGNDGYSPAGDGGFGGKVRSFHVANVTGSALKPVLRTQIDRASYLMTDEAPVYKSVGREFDGHGTVNHSIDEYVRGTFWHTNTVENYFSILKRGVVGTYHHVSEAHLKRYVGEFDFRYNTRDISDAARANEALKGIEGKRMTYRRANQAGYQSPEGFGFLRLAAFLFFEAGLLTLSGF